MLKTTGGNGAAGRKRKASTTEPSSSITASKRPRTVETRASSSESVPRKESKLELDLCSSCSNMFLDAQRREDTYVDEKHWEHMTSSDCDSCALLASAFPLNTLKGAAKKNDLGTLYRLIPLSDTEFPSIAIHSRSRGQLVETGCLHVDLNHVKSLKEIPATVDANTLTSFLARCQQSHGKHCGKRALPLRHSAPIEILLVDVFRDCIAMRTTASKYFALSYVWGNAITTTTTTQNFVALQQPGSLSNSMVLPKTVSDAIFLTRKMGVRYIWIDCLSIIQDSPQKHRDITNMDIIYSQAELTIVAATSRDANSGLAGVRPGTRRRRVTSSRLDLYTLRLELPLDKFHLLDGTIYSTRGWTFQELVLSKRLLFVTEHQIVFHCDTSWCSESLQQETTPGFADWGAGPIDLQRERSLSHNAVATLQSHTTMVQEYSIRQLSFDQDIENAFAGLASILEGWCEGNPVIHGMMSSFFRHSLTWIFQSYQMNEGGDEIGKRRKGFPSWSWVGWSGMVTHIYDTSKKSRHLPVWSLIKRVKIRSSGQHERSIFIKAVDESAQEAGTETTGQQILVELKPERTESEGASLDTLEFDGERTHWKNFAVDRSCSLDLESTFVFTCKGKSSSCGFLSIAPGDMILHELFDPPAPATDCDWSLVRMYQSRLVRWDGVVDKLQGLLLGMEYSGMVEDGFAERFRRRLQRRDLFYVLLVRREGLHWERVGSGLMFAKDWPSSSNGGDAQAYNERIVLV